MKPPIGVVISIPATLPSVMAVPICPAVRLQEHADDRAAGLHVRHKKIKRKQRPEPNRLCTLRIVFAAAHQMKIIASRRQCRHPDYFRNPGAFAMTGGTKHIEMDLTPMVQIDVLEKLIERIKETCAMMGIAEKFDRVLPDLATFLEAEVARGETRETRLTFDGLLYLKQRLAKG